jgi:hypothetical protein
MGGQKARPEHSGCGISACRVDQGCDQARMQKARVLAKFVAPMDGNIRLAMIGMDHFDAAPTIEGRQAVDVF